MRLRLLLAATDWDCCDLAAWPKIVPLLLLLLLFSASVVSRGQLS